MKFKDVKEGMFFYRTDRGSMLYVDEKGNYNFTAYVYSFKLEEFTIDSYNIARWERTIWGEADEAANSNYVSHKMIMGLFEIGKIKYEV